MLQKFKYICYLAFFLIFIVFVIVYYFSEKNIINTNKSRSFSLVNENKNMNNIPLLKNDTSDIIEYSTDVEVFKEKKKKYKFWELIKKK